MVRSENTNAFLGRVAQGLCGCKGEAFSAGKWFYSQELSLELSRKEKVEITKSETQLLCSTLA